MGKNHASQYANFGSLQDDVLLNSQNTLAYAVLKYLMNGVMEK